MIRTLVSKYALLWGMFLLVPGLVSAEDSVTIEADEAEISASTGIIRYQGNVVIVHPKLTIHCDTLEFVDTDSKRSFLTIGTPATIVWKHGQTTSTGSADSILYEETIQKKYIILKGHARIKHLGNSVEGEYIRYDFLTQSLVINSVDQDSPAGAVNGKERIRIILKQK